ncbi:MBL fold metallo-hydrolase [Candidatus Bathyarchaeota archaeon]|jgi:glyoxylase-like metal-dependent hydrolase (beta-lactamase superfamily II)|nr:MBL fold metallo-hydrolase [Candidatus Bathyarchaeota archaeon]MBT4319373.1 MBL fold metallo-hydrolase [Candidatus Bathyarchaeota archaeon]MBT6604936.1 MBL fold metallo-hydrolase [Candidatus Bathyarchaeota archaeon]MBT7346097.1 MBL fold metallo-hydrolase [Candidatus Bathyarchaeota archaeon]
MKNVVEIFDDLFLVKQDMRPGWYYSVFVVFGENNIGIIDTGFENTLVDYVLPLLQGKGRNLCDVDLIVNTHRDGDHIKGNDVFKEKTGASIVAHSLAAEAIPSLDKTMEEGDVMKLGDRLFKVIHTPGHRPGAVCMLDEEHKVIITGDSVCGEKEDLIRMDKNIYIESLRRLLELDVDIMIMSHPFKPAGKNILKGDEIGEMIRASIGIAERL